jgi:hypothetical protein
MACVAAVEMTCQSIGDDLRRFVMQAVERNGILK